MQTLRLICVKRTGRSTWTMSSYVLLPIRWIVLVIGRIKRMQESASSQSYHIRQHPMIIIKSRKSYFNQTLPPPLFSLTNSHCLCTSLPPKQSNNTCFPSSVPSPSSTHSPSHPSPKPSVAYRNTRAVHTYFFTIACPFGECRLGTFVVVCMRLI